MVGDPYCTADNGNDVAVRHWLMLQDSCDNGEDFRCSWMAQDLTDIRHLRPLL